MRLLINSVVLSYSFSFLEQSFHLTKMNVIVFKNLVLFYGTISLTEMMCSLRILKL